MHFARGQAIFENRYDAGRQLAEKLSEYKGQSVIVLAIPNGGAAVALEVALALEADLAVVEADHADLDHAIRRGVNAGRLEVDHDQRQSGPGARGVVLVGQTLDALDRLRDAVGDAGVVTTGGEAGADVFVRGHGA